MITITDEIKNYVRERFTQMFDADQCADFDEYFDEYLSIQPFAPNGNVNDKQSITDEAHFIMRTVTQFYLLQAFNAMKIDMNDANVGEDLDTGNIGTPGRIAKVWCGFDTHDDKELGGGRWSQSPRLASFPDESIDDRIIKGRPITKRVDIISNCSHHFIPFHTKAREDSYAIISYIPNEFKLGISKLQRIANHVSQRFWLQEDLADSIYKEIADAAQTDDVYVGLFNLVHGCESLRGSMSSDGCFTNESYGGKFADPELRKQIKG